MSTQLIYQDELLIDAAPEQVRGFITDAERILDYYPGGFRHRTLVAAEKFCCYGCIGASLLEVEQCNDMLITLKVYNCLPTLKNHSAEHFKQRALFIMYEDWQLYAQGRQTRIIKTWRHIEQPRWRCIPKLVLTTLVTFIAKTEHNILIKAWNKAAAGKTWL